MRLVDADKADMPVMQREDNGWVFRFTLKEMLDALPTVEAIPVKWINMWLLKNVFIWEATTTANETDRLQAIENIKYGFETMLKEWEKENEISKR